MAVRFTYKDAGVDQAGADAFAHNILAHMRSTFGPQVIDNPAGYGGLFGMEGSAWLLGRRYRRPVLVGCTDGVGTKLKVAFLMNKHDTVGIDLVAMSVNDLICEGAKPLFFLDYIAAGRLDPPCFEQIVRGVAEGCRQADCALLGGETAQLPDFYQKGEYDLVGFAVGVVERDRIIDGRTTRPGHVVVALASNGLHSNGFSLARRILFDHAGMSVQDTVPDLGRTLGEELLRPTRIYSRTIQSLRAIYNVKRIPSGIAHITGGGIPGNLPRILPEDCAVRIKRGSWPVPPIFDLIQRTGHVEDEEMFRTFNMGVGMVLLVPPYYVDAVVRRVERQGEKAFVIGEVRRGKRSVTLVR